MRMFKSLLAAGLIALATPALAHTDMMGSHPMDGAMMMEQVGELKLNFGKPVRLVNVKLISSDNRPVAIDFSPIMEPGTDFSVPVPVLKPDNYTVHWTTMGDDGHRMKGSFGFMQH
ncbi:copper resistance CopC family protein [Marinobacterium sediminicola]|uniref:CopC domain-containing protein n=1 Tax=Marinobacterium sediminicola TaxID=518898 RepID=A0ABY1S2G4_9GAMM|nr:copper resistance CopC family protein [Marinobacterium sediminicola]ULG68483.1 copper resistance protein CopC [Marinobacterium sediminicola]SMR76737.1 hypothetical protein SAMN04487964_11276 [Marinobacterium sediminicola]